MKPIVILLAHYKIRMTCLLLILHLCVINYILADSGEGAALHSFPGSIQRSSVYVTGCHCNCTSNNNDLLSNIGFFPCQSFGCVQCAPTEYDVCVAAYTDNEGNQEYGMYVCLTDQDQSTAMCLFNLPIPYFICEQTDGGQSIECQYERGNDESLCTFKTPSKTIEDGCYPLAPSCPDSSRVCCENARDCNCLTDIFAPSSDICLQKSVANSLWGSCACDTNTNNGSPVCGACGECDDDDDDDDSDRAGTNDVPGTNPTGDGGGDIGGFDESHQDPVKIAGIVVPIVLFLVVGLLIVWRSGGIPKCIKRGCNCEETSSMSELPVKRSASGHDQENQYEIETNEEPHFYAGVQNLGSTTRSERDGPLTNAQEDTNGYLWYRGDGSSKKESSNLDQNKKDPGDGLVYYELEETKEKVEDVPVADTTPEYLEFDADGKPEPTGNDTQLDETARSTEQPSEIQASPVGDGTEGESQYGKLDRSLDKSGHRKSYPDPPEDDEYGHLEPVKNDSTKKPGSDSSAQTYEALDRNRMQPVDENLNVTESGAEYGELDMTEAEQHTAPATVASSLHATTDCKRIRTPDDMPPSSEEVYGTL